MSFFEGDIFYTVYDQKFHLYKLLRSEDEYGTYHVLGYVPLDELPSVDGMHELDVAIHHFPIASDGFEGATFFAKSEVSEDDLMGYRVYLDQMGNYAEIAAQANEFYQEGYRLTDERKFDEAIESYTKAIELAPVYYEAIDNRAFCKMDLGRWEDAIEDFRLSLSVNPLSILAEFSIGECFLRLGDYDQARGQFEKALTIDPEHQPSKVFLKKAMEGRQ